MRRLATTGAIAMAMIVPAACRQEPTIQTLARPAHVWFRQTGLCGRSVAMDKDGVLWSEAGCENSKADYARIRTLTAPERDKVLAAFALLEHAPVEAPPADCRLKHRFIVMKDGDAYQEWQACAAGATNTDPTVGLTEPYATVVRDLPLK